ncbi:hypothetical protein ACJZ2D_017029 [Fusarium nematophilum]
MNVNCSRGELLPWVWALQPPDLNPQNCPSSSLTLGVVAIVGVLSTVLCLITGHQAIIRPLTWCPRVVLRRAGLSHFADKLFKEPQVGEEDTSYKRSWIWTFGLEFVSNAVVAQVMITASSSSPNPPSVGDFMLFLFMRPRMTWLIFCITVPPSLLYNDKYTRVRTCEPGSWLWNLSKAAYQHIIAEAAIQVVGADYAGLTAHFATTRGYYLANALDGCPLRADAKTMYAGALIYLVFLLPTIFIAIGILFHESYAGAYRRNSDPLLNNFYLSLVGWVGSWLFFSGYVRLAGDLYCPVSLVTQAAIWISFSVFGKTPFYRFLAVLESDEFVMS